VATSAGEPERGRGFFGHPRGLANLFGIEIWERFSFYGMQAILAYYLYFTVTRGGLGLPEAAATSLVGAYGGLVYVATIIGAWLADRLLGSERSVFYGGVLILLGHVSLALLPGLGGVAVGLVCVAIGSGVLKANTVSLLGSLYAERDTRRDGGFSLLYMGVNIGALIGPLLTGLLQTRIGFHYGFGLAAIGMAAGLVQYAIGRKNFAGAGRDVPNPLDRTYVPRVVIGVVIVVAVIVAAFASGLVKLEDLATITTVIIAVASVAYFAVILASRRITPTERSRVVAFIPMFIASFAFFSLFQQIFTVIAIYAESRVDLTVGGFAIPPSWAQSADPIGIMIFAPIFAALWTKLGTRQPSTPVKFALGLIGMGVCFLLFLPFAGGTGRSSPALLIGVILLLFSVPELLLSPIGLSVSTKLAPKVFGSQMVALNYLSVAAGTSAAGALAALYAPQHELAYFGLTGGTAVILGLAMAAVAPWTRRAMKGVH